MDLDAATANFHPEHLRVRRSAVGIPYWHHGVRVAEDVVVENAMVLRAPPTRWPELWRVRVASLDSFSRGGEVLQVEDEHRLGAEEVRHRALGAVGRLTYGLTSMNCVHFSGWCFTGHVESRQVNDAIGYVRYVGDLLSGPLLKTALRKAQAIGDAKWQRRWDAAHDCEHCGRRHGWDIGGKVAT